MKSTGMMQATPDAIIPYSLVTTEEVTALAISNVALAFMDLPPSLHLSYMISIMHGLEVNGGFDWSAHGDCVVEAIQERLRGEEW